MTSEQPAQPTLPPLQEREWRHVLWGISASGVLSITLSRPERLNALNFRLLREMHQLISYARSNPEIRVVTIRGQGTRSFCSGDDLKGMEPEPGIDSSATVHHQLVTAIRELPKPVVALVCGWALGHGFELACACDLRLCADNKFDKLAPVPIWSRAAIHFRVIIVSARSFTASFSFARSPLSACAQFGLRPPQLLKLFP